MRARLPARRGSTTVRVDYADVLGLSLKAHVTYSRNDAGRIAEVFISAGKPGSQAEAAYRDAALVVSMALQHGTPLEDVAAAMTRDEAGRPAGPLGVIMDVLMKEDRSARPEEVKQ